MTTRHSRIRDYYRERAPQYESEHSRQSYGSLPFSTFVGDFLREQLSVVGPLVDLGAGTGRAAREVEGDWTLVDFSADMLRRARVIDSSRVCADVEMLPFADHTFGGAAMISSLQYLDLEGAMTEVSRVLRPNAVVVVGTVVVADADVDAWRDRAFQDLKRPYLGRFRHRSAIGAAAHNCGLRQVGEKTVHFRRRFSRMSSDKSRTNEAQTLDEGIEVWQGACERIKNIYKVDTDGFEQTYSLLAFVKGASAVVE